MSLDERARLKTVGASASLILCGLSNMAAPYCRKAFAAAQRGGCAPAVAKVGSGGRLVRRFGSQPVRERRDPGALAIVAAPDDEEAEVGGDVVL